MHLIHPLQSLEFGKVGIFNLKKGRLNAVQELMNTALHSLHIAAGAKMASFNGWSMPISYEGVLSEHRHVREKAGLFDVSHMGEFFIRGEKALEFLQYMTINDVRKLQIGQGQYTAMCNDLGGVVDDLILYRTREQEFLACVNAGNIRKDFLWLSKYIDLYQGVSLSDESSSWSQIAIQGPNSSEALLSILESEEERAIVAELQYSHICLLKRSGQDCFIARTGYTGEKGFEVYVPNSVASQFWGELMNTKPKTDIKAIGLGARDTLRLEANYLLYGNDMDEEVSPLEAGISWATKLDKGEFLGSRALLEQKKNGIPRRNYAFILAESGIPRSGMEVFLDDEAIGVVTSGSALPTIGGSGGMTLLKAGKVKMGDEIRINIRGRLKRANIVKKPMYLAKTKG